MSGRHFDVGDEAVDAIWNGLAAELNEATGFGDLPSLVLDVARCHFHNVLVRLPEYVLCGVVDTTDGAAPFLGVAVRDGFRLHLAGVAEDLMRGGGRIVH